MIKMPMEVQVSGATDWRDCLREAWVKTEALRQEADIHRADSQVYIRPILLVQVERVGKDQRESQMIHSDEAKEYLISLGLPEEAIAIKTSEQNDLKNPENQNLLERGNPIRVIITKQALQEGWDCPFAYVLCALAVSRSVNALTQLVGRVLRQPYAAKTGRESLDRCYIYTHRAETGDVVKAIKAGLEKDGMGDLTGMVVIPSAKVSETVTRYRRDPLKGRTFYLPEVKVAETHDRLRNLDWETDILAQVDWLSMHFEDDGREYPMNELTDETHTLVVGLEVLKKPFSGGGAAIALDPITFDRQFAVRSISGTVDNPWVANAVVERFVSGLRSAGWTEREMAARQSKLREKLTDAVGKRLEAAAKTIFDQGLKAQRIRFHLTTSASDWKAPVEETIVRSGQLSIPLRNDGQPFQHSLFEPVLNGEMNGLEFDVACFLDRQSAVWWWYRNVVRGSAYGLQGWRKNRVYPDFVIAHQMVDNMERWFVVETKGNQLSENLDTKYKAELMNRLTDAYSEQSEAVLGELLIKAPRAEYRCKLVAQDGWEAMLLRDFESASSAGTALP
jgi:type III restriction enzyme